MKIQTKKLSEIKPYWRNARKNDRTIDALKQSIKKYGYNQPISIDAEGVIITGHARYKALMQLGYDEINVIIVDHLSDKKVKEYRIADNKTHELTLWNNEDLVLEMREIDNVEDMQAYFPNINLNNWLEDSVGFNLNDMSPEDFKSKEEKMNNVMTDINQSHLDQTIDVTCPHCLAEFALKKSDIL
jgi:site-specific DNA-methyltransferase (adenine-specific)